MPADHTDLHLPSPHQADALAAYALGVLDADERAAVEAHLAGCLACRAELMRQEAVVGEIGFAAAPAVPGPELREALLARARESGGAPAPSPRRFRLPPLALAAAVVALVSIVVLAALLTRTIEQRDEARYGEQRMAEYLANGGTLSPLQPAPDAPADARPGSGSLAIAPSQDRAMLVVYDLEPSVDGWRYMAWAEQAGERVRLGEVEVDEQGVGWLVFYPPESMVTYDAVGINRVPPGSDASEPFLVASVE